MVTTLVTVGHSTLDQQSFARLLTGAGVRQVVDVRRHPGSRRHPHFARAAMARWLGEAGIDYDWSEDLGGRRSVPADSPDTALRETAFRGYAAHMRTPAFAAALGDVLDRAATRRTAVLCAESVWWRCHRRMIADAAALLHGAEVLHLMPDGRLAPHGPNPAARRTGPHLVYDATGEPRLDPPDAA